MSSFLQNPQLTKQMQVEMCFNRHYTVPPRILTHNCASQFFSTLASNAPRIPLLLFLYIVTIRLCWDFQLVFYHENQLITLPLHIKRKMFILFNKACHEHIYTTIWALVFQTTRVMPYKILHYKFKVHMSLNSMNCTYSAMQCLGISNQQISQLQLHNLP